MNEVLELSCRGQQTSTNSLPRGHHLDPAPAQRPLPWLQSSHPSQTRGATLSLPKCDGDREEECGEAAGEAQGQH